MGIFSKKLQDRQPETQLPTQAETRSYSSYVLGVHMTIRPWKLSDILQQAIYPPQTSASSLTFGI
jgi:hypothetical protein